MNTTYQSRFHEDGNIVLRLDSDSQESSDQTIDPRADLRVGQPRVLGSQKLEKQLPSERFFLLHHLPVPEDWTSGKLAVALERQVSHGLEVIDGLTMLAAVLVGADPGVLGCMVPDPLVSGDDGASLLPESSVDW